MGFDYGINNTTEHSISCRLCFVSENSINANTLVLFFNIVDLINGCMVAPNVVNIHLSNFSLGVLLTFKPGLIIYPILNSLVCFFVSLSQIKHLPY